MGNPALDEFRERFTAQLVDHIDEHYGGRVDPDALRPAIDVATANWRVTEDRDLVRGADGDIGSSQHPTWEAKEPATHLRRLTVTGEFLRDETAEEAAEIMQRIERRAAAWRWSAGDHTQPPPDGVDIMALLEQRTWWRPKGAEPALLTALAPSHRAHLLAFLRRNAALYKRVDELAFIRTTTGPSGPQGDMSRDTVDREMTELLDTTPQVWIEQRPLVKRLRRLVRRDEKAAEGTESTGPDAVEVNR
jgi:hypothetical protein